jgi:hypothetical protein
MQWDPKTGVEAPPSYCGFSKASNTAQVEVSFARIDPFRPPLVPFPLSPGHIFFSRDNLCPVRKMKIQELLQAVIQPAFSPDPTGATYKWRRLGSISPPRRGR